MSRGGNPQGSKNLKEGTATIKTTKVQNYSTIMVFYSQSIVSAERLGYQIQCTTDYNIKIDNKLHRMNDSSNVELSLVQPNFLARSSIKDRDSHQSMSNKCKYCSKICYYQSVHHLSIIIELGSTTELRPGSLILFFLQCKAYSQSLTKRS